MTDIAKDRAWRAALLAAIERKKRTGGEIIDIADLLTSPEAQAAIGLTAGLISLCTTPRDKSLIAGAVIDGDLRSFRDSGHDGPLAYAPSPRCVEHWMTDGGQKYRLACYCRWRAAGGDPADEPTAARELEPRLRAVANAAGGSNLANKTGGSEIAGLSRDLGEGEAMLPRRMREYREIGRKLLAADPGLGDVRYGPPPEESGLPRRSWQPAPPTDEPAPEPEPEAAPEPPAPSI
ncbi:hypothetical protein [Telmatospirillum sp.]|uniref:hypothetical protein n=1 Tax=Telmatospirillum sp. TaxID=2079197 RepID=UPI00284D469B|nr:hypothetical protein [Telmatospirillum sp.]MDR3436310.1 hypothetical protein [Telmatospirillum sp.]